MEFTIVEGLRTLRFDLVFTLALAALFLFTGYAIQRRVPLLARSHIPGPVIGGLLFALIALILHTRAHVGIALDTTLRAPLQTAFFTTIGLSATFSLLRAGGWRMVLFWFIASVLAVLQTVVGIGLARAMNAPAALGIICGALTLTGGPATGIAFADSFERAGITGASALIIASATFGIITASLVGNPVATLLIRRFRLASHTKSKEREVIMTEQLAVVSKPVDDDAASLTSGALLHALLLILLIMGVGALIGLWLTRAGVTLPGYVGAMVVAAAVRNVDDSFGWFKINVRAVEALAVVTLALFLVIALMDLKLWQLAGLAVPMLVILVAQVLLMIAYALFVTFVSMGRDYEAAVTASGHIGFGLGITPNAVANMEALVEGYGRAPRSFLIVPIVGAFFIDFSNALIITAFINLVR